MLAHLAPVALAASLLVGCYDVPKPACGFACGPNGECPADYTCNAADGQCHLNGSSPSLVCGMIDAGAGDDAIDAPDDLDPPTIVSVVPEDGAVGVSRSVTIEVRFSEPVIGINASTARVLVEGDDIDAARTYDGVLRLLRIVPSEPLPSSTVVTVRIDSGILDRAGNLLAPMEWSFTTIDETTDLRP
jgi:hypothetical protein